MPNMSNEVEISQWHDFIKQTEILRPVLTADGYFNLDYDLLFKMLQLLITYVVVLIQMK